MISAQHKVLFVHIPKCAGRSIADAFNIAFDHYTAAYYTSTYPDIWSNYLKFTIVRNPLDRFVSIYHYMIADGNHLFDDICFNGKMPDFKTWLIANIENYRNDYSCESIQGMRETDGELGSSFWFGSQSGRLYDHHGVIDRDMRIFKFETDLYKIPGFIRTFAGRSILLPHSNRSEHDHYLTYYDQELIDVVKRFPPVQEDCEVLKINLPSSVTKNPA